MRKIILACTVLSALLVGCSQPQPQQEQEPPVITTFILVRHAEKADDGTKDPPLTEDGAIRANDLVKLFHETKINAIYSTPYKRTQETVAPIAEAKGLSVLSYEPMKGEVMDSLLNTHSGGTVLVSGHSNTTPWVANYFLGAESFPNFEDSDYDNVMVLSIIEKGNAKVTWLNYGTSTN
ncbi:MAG: phosphoglycerate mutase family protein [Cyclobacteriaceae bacterium]